MTINLLIRNSYAEKTSRITQMMNMSCKRNNKLFIKFIAPNSSKITTTKYKSHWYTSINDDLTSEPKDQIPIQTHARTHSLTPVQQRTQNKFMLLYSYGSTWTIGMYISTQYSIRLTNCFVWLTIRSYNKKKYGVVTILLIWFAVLIRNKMPKK